MNKQRKVLITITYNEMGIIIDTKAEEVTQPNLQPNLQPTCNQLATDSISRQAAIDTVDEMPVMKDNNGIEFIEKSLVKTRIGLLPSAESERKAGRWLEKEVFHEVESSAPIEQWQSAKCSACGKYHTTPYLYYFNVYAFCPHCGADMRGKQDE